MTAPTGRQGPARLLLLARELLLAVLPGLLTTAVLLATTLPAYNALKNTGTGWTPYAYQGFAQDVLQYQVSRHPDVPAEDRERIRLMALSSALNRAQFGLLDDVERLGERRLSVVARNLQEDTDASAARAVQEALGLSAQATEYAKGLGSRYEQELLRLRYALIGTSALTGLLSALLILRALPAGHCQIDFGQQSRVEQRTVQFTMRVVDAIALAQRIETRPLARMQLLGHRHRVGHLAKLGDPLRSSRPLELGVQKADVKRRVVNDDLGTPEQLDEHVGNLSEARLVGQKRRGQSVNLECAGIAVAVGIEVPAVLADKPAPTQLDAADLDDPVISGFESCGFGVENDLTSHVQSGFCCVRRRSALQGHESCPRHTGFFDTLVLSTAATSTFARQTEHGRCGNCELHRAFADARQIPVASKSLPDREPYSCVKESSASGLSAIG